MAVQSPRPNPPGPQPGISENITKPVAVRSDVKSPYTSVRSLPPEAKETWAQLRGEPGAPMGTLQTGKGLYARARAEVVANADVSHPLIRRDDERYWLVMEGGDSGSRGMSGPTRTVPLHRPAYPPDGAGAGGTGTGLSSVAPSVRCRRKPSRSARAARARDTPSSLHSPGREPA